VGSRVNWTRDEVILALDLYFSSGKRNFPVTDSRVLELSELLQELPIVPESKRAKDFRNANGISYQLTKFAHSVRGSKSTIGRIFFDVYEDYQNDRVALHEVANAIRNAKKTLRAISFGNPVEQKGFREGALLSHLHRHFETEYLKEYEEEFRLTRCSICRLDLSEVYQVGGGQLYELHLTVHPKYYSDKSRFIPDNFVVVCPNCHEALHRTRPWLDKDAVDNILR
jgi:5-methylcytosine-specific restriction protein A